MVKKRNIMLDNLKKYTIFLASGSPRRRQLLADLGIDFEVRCLNDIDESYPDDMPADDVAEYISQKKATAYKGQITGNELYITADTVVVCDGRVLGKPTDRNEAVAMLRRLSGNVHHVVTGVTVVTECRSVSFSVATEVSFARLTDEEINFYVDNFKPLDKAGAYGIQEWIGFVGVESISGSYFNVMGLPVQRLYQELKRL